MTTPTVYGYARVSREDQELALQLDALAAHGVSAANIVTEKMSGAKNDRPAWQGLLARLQPGDSLVAWKVDRLGRSAIDALTTAADLKARGVRVVIITLGVDSTTPAGEMVFGIMAQLAQFERAQLIERTNAGLAAAKRRGVVMGRKNKLTALQRREVAMMVASGRSMQDVARVLNVGKSIVARAVWRERDASAGSAPIAHMEGV